MYSLSLLSGIGLGVLSGRILSSEPGAPTASQQPIVSTFEEEGVYRLSYVADVFTVDQTPDSDLKQFILRPDPLKAEGRMAASRLMITSVPLQDQRPELAPQSDDLFAVTLAVTEETFVAGVPFKKTTYKHAPLYSDTAADVFSVQWEGVVGEQVVLVEVSGLIDSAAIPVIYEPVFASIEFSHGPGVLGSSITKMFTKQKKPSALEDKYIADAISPAVVKLYNVVCGVVFVEGRQASQEGCKAVVGSGFFVSSDGYIATNGHVVVFEPEDAFVQLLFNEPNIFQDYLRNNGLNDSQIQQIGQRSDLVAAVVAEIYKLPKGTVELRDREQIIIAALGDEPLEVADTSNFRQLAEADDTDTLKRAKLIAADFSSRDIYVVSSGDQAGFSSSDVALLKIDIKNAPFIRSLENSIVTQNQKISVLGFPADAENALIDRSSLAVTVTNGTIGSIRAAAGGDYKLFQSDADASQGSSGGPAITNDGRVFGLLTYRFKNETVQDAAKSYIRDFTDVKRLALQNGVSFSQTGDLQENWENGLRWYAQGYYSTALELFEEVQSEYPSHRLAPEYIAASKQAIDAGKDVSPQIVNYYAVGLAVGIIGTIGATLLIVRHHGRHKLYRFHIPHHAS